MTRKLRPTFIVTLRAEKGIDPARALKAALKTLLRKFGLRAISVTSEEAE